jgi:hypothetical protein
MGERKAAALMKLEAPMQATDVICFMALILLAMIVVLAMWWGVPCALKVKSHDVGATLELAPRKGKMPLLKPG